jgi:hypothetical protein
MGRALRVMSFLITLSVMGRALRVMSFLGFSRAFTFSLTHDCYHKGSL